MNSASESFAAFAEAAVGGPFRAEEIETVQVNIGLVCNLSCVHCHVESSPTRRERMEWPTMQAVLAAAERAGARIVDVTGGAPEMHPRFREFVVDARRRGFDVIVRTNLTILMRAGFADLPRFFREQRVRLVASLPCYLEENVDRQRGANVHHDSIEALRALNAVGFGIEPDLVLDLVFNPLGPALPPDQAGLEQAYRRELDARHGVRFHRLLTIANMAIGRFAADLAASGRLVPYEALLRERSRPENAARVMCRRQIHVGPDGSLHDCDFNFALGLRTTGGAPEHVADFDPDRLRTRTIATAPHCYGCTAGSGSSCGGALA